MKNKNRSGWWWVPSLYYAEGIPYVLVMMVSVVMYKRLGISNTDIALYTSWLYLPWVIKPFWSPLVDILKTKRYWITTMQLLIGAGLAGVALTIPVPNFFQYTLAFFWLLAFSSATHDIAADGFYMLGLSEHDQAWFVGVRGTFYRLAMITGQGLLIIIAGWIESNSGLENVEFTVQTVQKRPFETFIHPDSIQISALNGEQRIITFSDEVQISTTNRNKHEVDSLINFAYQWNLKNGFIVPDRNKQNQAQQDMSWWDIYIKNPLEGFLKNNFGKDEAIVTGNTTGNIGFVYFWLAQNPSSEENIVVNFGRNRGDKSIFLIDSPAIGSRVTFNESNWNKPAIAAIQLDKKLSINSEAIFLAQSGNIPLAWSITFFVLAGFFVVFFLYHKFILPFPASDKSSLTEQSKNIVKEFVDTFVLFFKKDKIGGILAFLLMFRLAESQLVKLASPFLLDTQEMGGLALTTGELGLVYGTIGLLFLTIGGLFGGFLAAKHGLKFWLWPMAIAINLPDLVYVYLSYTQPDSFLIINLCVAIEQLGYGFGFTAYMLFMIFASQGEHKTAHFAITTAFMALGMMIPGMLSGWLQEIIGYQNFFNWVIISTIPSFLVLFLIPIDKDFGKKKE